jgi:peptidoglycan/xylan/chitin deacetylase (PgdA/CDA1 family)
VTNPLTRAAKAKGGLALIKRVWTISQRYGLTPARMDQALAQFAQVLRQFNCDATLPITAIALERCGRIIESYRGQGIEFAVHGYFHIDYSQLPLAEQITHLVRARRPFSRSGIPCAGFRSPYLRWNQDTLRALSQQGFSYDSSQALAWDVVGGSGTDAYRRALDFYGAQSASEYPALPRLEGNLVRIPYCLPDDEAIVERLALSSLDEGVVLWQAILRRTYEMGELFTLGLHPERIAQCRSSLAATLASARELSPAVWIARLDEIAEWWRARSDARVTVEDVGDGRFEVTVQGPPGTTILTRAVQVEAPFRPWTDGYRRVDAPSFVVHAAKRPFIGVAAHGSDQLVRLLRQQGYLVERTTDPTRYSLYLDRSDLAEHDERPLLARMARADGPLVRLGRWPDGARSALAITGDVDALTLWDYGWRFLRR